jgi:endonuclease/exonuclease/phosphatase family metal-dependent hydrolase
MTERLRILSYNIRKAVGLDGRRDPERIQRVIAESGADVVVLQEADRRLGARPAALPKNALEAETGYRLAHVAATDVSLGWHGNAVLVRPGLEILGTERLPLPGLEPRGAVRVEIAAGGLGRMIVIGAHLALIRRWRRRQLRALKDHLTPEERLRTVIAGDFNEWSLRSGFEPLGSGFAVHVPGRSFHTSYPVASLDRFVLGGALDVAASGVIRQGHARHASDHLPVWADIGRAPEAAVD